MAAVRRQRGRSPPYPRGRVTRAQMRLTFARAAREERIVTRCVRHYSFLNSCAPSRRWRCRILVSETVDSAGGCGLYNPSRRRRPPTRCDDAPSKHPMDRGNRLSIVIGSLRASAALRFTGERDRQVPGCLTSESEERETWTAESLRAASSNGEMLRKRRFFAEVRPDETSAVHVSGQHCGREAAGASLSAHGQSGTSSMLRCKGDHISNVPRRANVSDQPGKKFSSNLRV